MFTRLLLYIHELRKNLELKPSILQEVQQKKLRFMLKHAYENVPFYHRKFDRAGIRPDDLKSSADLSKVPMTTKSEIQAGPLEDMIAKNVDVSKCAKRNTSGSTGLPLTILVDKRTVDFDGAVWYRALLEIGLRLMDRMAIIADPRSFPKKRRWFQRFGIAQRKYVSIFDGAETQLAILRKFRPSVIKGYSSSMEILADFCRQIVLDFKPRFILTSAELLDDQSRKLISSRFEAEVFDNYSCHEFGLLAWECAKHRGYHMNIDSVLMEFIRNEETIESGERGEILCTTLVNQAMPLIRYRIGDVGIPMEEQCSCGRPLPLMKLLEGRMDDFLLALNGRIISPTVFFPYPFENLEEIKQFRVTQERRDKMTIELVTKDNFLINTQVLDKAKREIRKLFGEDMHVEFQFRGKINRDHTGKLRKIISHIPVRLAKRARERFRNDRTLRETDVLV